MKITKELKWVMQFNSFMGILASVFLIKMGVHTNLAYMALAINIFCLVDWCFIKEDNENKKED